MIVITLGIVLFSIKFMLVDLNPYTKNFRQYLLFPENLENREILDLKIISKLKKTNPHLPVISALDNPWHDDLKKRLFSGLYGIYLRQFT